VSPRRDPKWISFALKAYDACLPLYPRAVREAHGEEMRQAFRDRCREVARGQRGAFQWLGEMAPDLIGSAARAHVDERGKSDARWLPGLLLLFALLGVAFATQERWTQSSQDNLKAAEVSWKMWLEVREARKRDALLADASAHLVAQGDPESLAVAALVHRGLYEQWRWYMLPVTEGNFEQGLRMLRFPREGELAAELAGGVAAKGGSPAALIIAAQACEASAGCNADLALRRLLARDPDNAYGWMLEFRRAAALGDAARMQAALAGAGRARVFESHASTTHKLLLGALTPAQRADADSMRRVGEHLDALRWLGINGPDSLLYNCSFRTRSPNNPERWIDSHPQARADCLHFAVLMANSTDVVPASYGWRQLRRAGVALSRAQVETMRDMVWLAGHRQHFGKHLGADLRSWTEWTATDWTRWDEAWAPGDGERAAMRRWLSAQGVPVRAPAGKEGDVRD
jgi:hypothetical protein